MWGSFAEIYRALFQIQRVLSWDIQGFFLFSIRCLYLEASFLIDPAHESAKISRQNRRRKRLLAINHIAAVSIQRDPGQFVHVNIFDVQQDQKSNTLITEAV